MIYHLHSLRTGLFWRAEDYLAASGGLIWKRKFNDLHNRKVVCDTVVYKGSDAADLNPWKYFSRKSLCAGMWVFSSRRGIGSNVGAGYCPTVTFLIVTSYSTGNCCEWECGSITILVKTLTLRPQYPKSCKELAITSIPSHSIVWISISSYSSVTVGRKKTRRPPGFSKYRAKSTRSVTSCDNSYGFVGGMYGWSSLIEF